MNVNQQSSLTMPAPRAPVNQKIDTDNAMVQNHNAIYQQLLAQIREDNTYTHAVITLNPYGTAPLSLYLGVWVETSEPGIVEFLVFNNGNYRSREDNINLPPPDNDRMRVVLFIGVVNTHGVIRNDVIDIFHIISNCLRGLQLFNVFDIFTFREVKSATTFTDKGIQRGVTECIFCDLFTFDIKFDNTLSRRGCAVVFEFGRFRHMQYAVLRIGCVRHHRLQIFTVNFHAHYVVSQRIHT